MSVLTRCSSLLKPLFVQSFIASTVLCSFSAIADITQQKGKALSSNELTNTYIKDSTIIVKKKKVTSTPSQGAKMTIKSIGSSPTLLENNLNIANQQNQEQERHNETLSLETQHHELTNQDNSLATGEAILQPYQTEGQITRDQFIKDTLNLPQGEPLDLSKINFGQVITDNPQAPVNGNSVIGSNNSFQIVIPNRNAIDPTKFSNHDGTLNTTITPQQIILEIVNPYVK